MFLMSKEKLEPETKTHTEENDWKKVYTFCFSNNNGILMELYSRGVSRHFYPAFALFFITHVHALNSFHYVGCFIDVYDHLQRDLGTQIILII